MSRQYPRLGSCHRRPKWIEHPKGAPKCCVCGAPATHRVCIEFNHFRGDDELVNACGDHCQDEKAMAEAWVKADKAKAGNAGVDASVGPPWCCEKGEAANVRVCADCAEASAGYSAAAGVLGLDGKTIERNTPGGA